MTRNKKKWREAIAHDVSPVAMFFFRSIGYLSMPCQSFYQNLMEWHDLSLLNRANMVSGWNIVIFSSGNLSLPGGFKMANSSNKYCDVATATGHLKNKLIIKLFLHSSFASSNASHQGSTAVSKWIWSLPENFLSTSWPSTSLASWLSSSPGSRSGWTTRQCQQGWPLGWPPCWPCPPPWAPYSEASLQSPTPRQSTSGPASVSSLSSVLS